MTTDDRVLAYIQRFLHREGYAPSVREIAMDLEFASTSTAEYHLARLERRGLIRRERRIARSIRLTHMGASAADRVGGTR